VRDASQASHRREAHSNWPVLFYKPQQRQIAREGNMGMVMVKCPQTGHAIPTGIKTDSASFGRRAVFFSRTHCPICRTDHAWFAREAWVDEPGIRTPSWGLAPEYGCDGRR
jgi:hypothetical protein